MKVLFMGTPQYAQEILQTLIEDDAVEVTAIYTQPDKPVGRKKVMTPPPVKQLALEHNIEVYQPNRLRDKDVIDELLQIECDFIVVAAYGQILPKEILQYRPCINLHASILPQYRGASPIQQTLLNGDTKTGVTAMLMDEGLDTGDIIAIKTVEVAPDMMLEALYKKLTTVAAELTLEVLKNFSHYTPQPQDDTRATYCKKITKADGLVNFEDALEIYNKYRAFTPWPGIYLKSGLKLKQIALEEMTQVHEAGTILAVEKDSIVVGCTRGSLRIFSVQPQSKKAMDVAAYINGKRIGVADTLS